MTPERYRRTPLVSRTFRLSFQCGGCGYTGTVTVQVWPSEHAGMERPVWCDKCKTRALLAPLSAVEVPETSNPPCEFAGVVRAVEFRPVLRWIDVDRMYHEHRLRADLAAMLPRAVQPREE